MTSGALRQAQAWARRHAQAGHRLAWAIGALFVGLFFFTFYQPPVDWIPRLIMAALVFAAIVRPYEALLIVALFGPLSSVLYDIGHIEAGGLRIFEAMVLAFLTGWTARHALWPSALRVPPLLVAWAALLLAAVIASGIVSGAVILAEQYGDLSVGLLDGGMLRDYAVTWGPLSAAMLFAEGVLLLIAAADTCGDDQSKRDGVQRMMILGAALAALFNVLRLVEISLAREAPWRSLLAYLASQRINVHHRDLNAAGSYFAMTLFVALAFVRKQPIVGIPATALIAAGLWISGSRTALAAVLLVALVAGPAALSRRPHRQRLVGMFVGVIAVAAIVLWAFYPSKRSVASPSEALSIRIGLAKAALAMAAANPLFGVGVGHFSERSEQYADGPFHVGPSGKLTRENAHNDFLQILGELGIPGLLSFLCVLGLALRAAVKHVNHVPWGLVAGLGAFLVSCIGGHPLIVPHAAYPFWTGMGVAADGAGSAPAVAARLKWTAAVLVLIVAATLPFRVAAAVRLANVEHTSIGFSIWHREPDGRRYRWAGGRSTFFVASSARAVRIPLRVGPDAPDILEVRIFLNGREVDRAIVRRDEGWRTVRLVLGRRVSEPFLRVDLEAGLPGTLAPLDVHPTSIGGLLSVGRPLQEE